MMIESGTAYHAEQLVKRLDDISLKLGHIVAIEMELLDMQKEMFEDYKKARERSHVKLQGDTEGNHATAHTA